MAYGAHCIFDFALWIMMDVIRKQLLKATSYFGKYWFILLFVSILLFVNITIS